MRIGLVSSEYHRGGGFPHMAADLAVGLKRLGHNVVVYSRVGHVTTKAEDDGIEFRHYRTVRGPMLLHMAIEPWVVGRIARREAASFDAFVSVGLPCLADVVLAGPGTHRAWYARTTRALSVFSPRRWIEKVRPFHRIVLSWERAMLKGRHPRLVLVPDRARAQEYVNDFAFPIDRIAYVPCPVNPGEFEFDAHLRAATRDRLGIPEDVPVLLNVARRGRQKGLDVLVEALERLPAEVDFCALFVGDGSTSAQLQAATTRLREAGKVHLLGRVPEVRPFYCAADLVVFPSRWDPWGLVVTEALACGVPVLCSTDIGAAAAIQPDVNGRLLADPEDPDEVARGIVELLGRRVTFDRDAVATTVEPFGRDAVAARLVHVLGAAR